MPSFFGSNIVLKTGGSSGEFRKPLRFGQVVKTVMTQIETLISGHEEAIAKKWLEAALKSYQAEAASFFLKEKNRFANPVSGMLSESLTKVVEGLAGQASNDDLAESLDPAIRVRAVQDFTPAQAVSFIFLLKQIIRDVVGKKADNAEKIRQVDQKIDELALIGFNKYVECREKIFKIQAYEVRNRTFKAFERAGLMVGPETDA